MLHSSSNVGRSSGQYPWRRTIQHRVDAIAVWRFGKTTLRACGVCQTSDDGGPVCAAERRRPVRESVAHATRRRSARSQSPYAGRAVDFVDFDISPTSLLSGFRGLCGFRFLGSGIPTKRSVTEVTVFCGKLYTKKKLLRWAQLGE